MKGIVRGWALVALTSWLLFSVTGHAQTGSAAKDQLLLLGPVESVDAKNGIAVVIGQKVLLKNLKRPLVGASVAVFGSLNSDGNIAATSIAPAGLYVSGASPIVLTGRIRAINPSLGRVTVGQSVIDFSSSLASNALPDLKIGDVVQFGGTQPASHGLVLANQFVVAQSDGIIGGGFSLSGIIGGGAALDGIIGGGSLTTTDGIIGGGLVSAEGIIGGGSN
jgi:hypothetical protein